MFLLIEYVCMCWNHLISFIVFNQNAEIMNIFFCPNTFVTSLYLIMEDQVYDRQNQIVR